MANRPIRFRAWNKKRLAMEHEIELVFYADHSLDVSSPLGGNTEDFDLMQFTGAVDMNGTEIFEDDLMQTSKGIVYRVMYSSDRGCFFLRTRNLWRTVRSDSGKYVYKAFAFGRCKGVVVGNYYQNPELLK